MRHFAQTEVDRQPRIIESFSKAIEQLGSDKLEVRLGGIYALERISQESARDYWTVMENLTAFVRERTQHTEAERTAKLDQRVAEHAYFLWENAGRPEGSEEFRGAVEREKYGEPPGPDVAAVLTVIVRRRKDHRELEGTFDFRRAVLTRANLRDADLRGANLFGAHLEAASLVGAHLERAHLSGAHLEGAILNGAHLEGALISGAHLERAHLSGAHLEGAFLGGTHLEGADLHGAYLDANLVGVHLEGANLFGAHLEGADLNGADLRNANLGDADLSFADLSGADLNGVKNLTQAQLGQACGTDAKLPEGLTLKPCPEPPPVATPLNRRTTP
ncbi:MAG TPA: pentapeptide repeat-containing protein [Bradyrhizobium sp.]|nr:pentapeptide repeat-containing protein [Bradyrhizobium sp.]